MPGAFFDHHVVHHPQQQQQGRPPPPWPRVHHDPDTTPGAAIIIMLWRFPPPATTAIIILLNLIYILFTVCYCCVDALPLVLYGCVLSPLLIPQVLTSSAGKSEHPHAVVGHSNINIQTPSSSNSEAWGYGSHCCLGASTMLKFYRTRRRGIRGSSSGERSRKKWAISGRRYWCSRMRYLVGTCRRSCGRMCSSVCMCIDRRRRKVGGSQVGGS